MVTAVIFVEVAISVQVVSSTATFAAVATGAEVVANMASFTVEVTDAAGAISAEVVTVAWAARRKIIDFAVATAKLALGNMAAL